MSNYDDEIIKNEYIISKVLNSIEFNNIKEFYYEDLFQIGRIALWEALKTYDKEKNDNFEAYAFFIIKNKIYNEIKYILRQKRNINKSVNNIRLDEAKGEEKGSLHEIIPEKNEFVVIDINNFTKELTKEELDLYKRKYKGQTNKQIMKETKIPQKRLKFTLEAIKRKLKNNIF